MRICIFGAGAVGGFLAGRLAQAGRDVVAVTRGAHLEAIRSRGITIEEIGGGSVTVPLRASDDPAGLGKQDLIVITAKTPGLAAAAEAVQPMLTPDTLVAFAVNGVFWFYGHRFQPEGPPLDLARLDPGGTLHRLIGPERALGMVIYSPNTVTAPGVVLNDAKDNRFPVGAPERETGRAEAVAAALNGCGFTVEATPDIRRIMWGKLIRNATTASTACLAGVSYSTIHAEPAGAEVGLAVMREAAAVAAAHGYDDLGIDPEKDAKGLGRNGHKPSILQDLERGRPMEIDSQLAILQDFGRTAGVPTPMLDILVPLVVVKARAAGCYP